MDAVNYIEPIGGNTIRAKVESPSVVSNPGSSKSIWISSHYIEAAGMDQQLALNLKITSPNAFKLRG